MMKSATLLVIFSIGMVVLANKRVKLPPCYWTGCVEFNGAECIQGYTSRTKETCGGLEGIVANKQRRRCCKSAGLIDVPPSIENNCGTSNLKSINGKITQGDLSVKGNFPWHVMLAISDTAYCGATLLNEQWIITAAHCFDELPISYFKVKLGKYNQDETEESEIVTNINKLIKHPDYNVHTNDNDIALIKLSHKVSFTSFIKPICLMNDKIDEYFQKLDSASGYVSGWGLLSENGEEGSRYLLQVRLPIVDQKRCKNSTKYEVTSNMFCAGYSNELKGDSCKGDSGGAFILNYMSQWFIFGIVSWGEGCDLEGKYGYYTRFNNYLDWIDSTIKQEEITSTPSSSKLEISDCYWTGCVEFNRAECAQGYTLMTKESCDGWQGIAVNKRRKWCCK